MKMSMEETILTMKKAVEDALAEYDEQHSFSEIVSEGDEKINLLSESEQ